MFRVTSNAVVAVRSITSALHLTGLRVVGDGSEISVLPARRPEPSDETVAVDGVRIFVDQGVESEFGECALDARIEAGRITFEVTRLA